MLPTVNIISDLENYWEEFGRDDERIGSEHKVLKIVEKLMAKGLIEEEENEKGKECAFNEDTRIFVPPTVKNNLRSALSEQPDNGKINFMLFRNYAEKLKVFCLTYMNVTKNKYNANW
jgi:hypothetical protein